MSPAPALCNCNVGTPPNLALPVPGIAQMVASSANPEGVGIGGNQFKFNLPNPTGAGNCIVLFMSWKWRASTTVTVADTNGNTWPASPTVTIGGGVAGQYESDCYILPNANAGNTKITVTFAPATIVNISSATGNGTTTTVNTASAHGLSTGDTAIIAGTSTALDNWWSPITVTSATQYTFASSFNGSVGAVGQSMLGVFPFQYTIYELYNVALVSPLDGNSTVSQQVGPTLSTGSFTPGNNDAWGGHFILSYFALGIIANNNPTSWVPVGSNFLMGDGDTTWVSNQGFPHASQYWLQTKAAALNPGITATGDTTNAYNGISIALKAWPAGTPPPPGIRINRILHYTNNTQPPGSNTLHLPSTGNLLVLTTFEAALINVTSITDSLGNTWVKQELDTSAAQLWYATGPAKTNEFLTITVNHTGAPAGITFICYDISGAANQAFDVAAGVDPINVSNLTSVQHCPDITPTTKNGLTIARFSIGVSSSGYEPSSPSGVIDDMVHYSNQGGPQGIDLMDNADGMAHVYNADLSLENWIWNFLAQPNNSCNCMCAHFKTAGS